MELKMQRRKCVQYLLNEDQTHCMEFVLQDLWVVLYQSLYGFQAVYFLHPECLRGKNELTELYIISVTTQITGTHLQFKLLLKIWPTDWSQAD